MQLPKTSSLPGYFSAKQEGPSIHHWPKSDFSLALGSDLAEADFALRVLLHQMRLVERVLLVQGDYERFNIGNGEKLS